MYTSNPEKARGPLPEKRSPIREKRRSVEFVDPAGQADVYKRQERGSSWRTTLIDPSTYITDDKGHFSEKIAKFFKKFFKKRMEKPAIRCTAADSGF